VTQHHKIRPVISPEPAAEDETKAAPRALASRWPTTRNAATLYAAVALGSVIGALLRASASLVIQDHFGSGFPWGTLFVNVTGSFAIGFYAALTGPDGRVFVGPRQRQFVMTGICGGYTTFSAFSLETFHLVQAGNLAAAGLNVGISVVTWLLAVWLGHILTTGLNRLKGS
jgi:CrcB protein